MPFPIHQAKITRGPGHLTIAQMPYGSYGVTPDGRIYLRMTESAVYLNNTGSSYTGGAADLRVHPMDDAIELLPPGSKIEITVGR